MDNSNNFSEIVAMVPLEDETDEDMSDLTMADKRAHHNALERKRRDHIKDSFYCLRDAVPQLRGEKVVASRALILNKATDYIKGLRTKNHCHKREIDDIKRQNEVLEQEIERIMRLNNSKEPDCKTLSSLSVSGEDKEKSHIRSSPPTWSRLSEVEDGLFIGKQPKQEECDEPASKQPNNSKQSMRGEPKYPPLKDSNYVTKVQDPNYKETNYKELNHKPQTSGGTIQIPASALARALPNGFKQKVTAIYKHTGSNKPIRLQIITPNKGGTPGTKTITTNAKIISNRTVTTSRTVTTTSRTLTTGSNPVRPSTAGPPAARPVVTATRPSSAINRPSAATISSSNAPLQTNQRSNPPVQHVASPAERREERRAGQGDSPVTVMHGARAPPGQNPFHCTICGKCFPMLSSLKVHEHIHVPVKKKPYPCDMCHRSFMTQRILQNHKEGHYGRISLPHRQIAQVRQKVANYSTHPPGYSSSPLDPPAIAVADSSPNPHSPRTTISNIFHVRAASPRESTTSPVPKEGTVITLVPKAASAVKPGQRSLPTTRVRQGQVIVQARPGGTSYKSPGSKTNRADLSPYGGEDRELGETPQYSKRLLHGGTMRLHGGSLVAASDSIHNPNQGTVRVTEPSHPKFKYGVGNEENKRARNFPASLKRSAPPKEEAEEVESKHLRSGS